MRPHLLAAAACLQAVSCAASALGMCACVSPHHSHQGLPCALQLWPGLLPDAAGCSHPHCLAASCCHLQLPVVLQQQVVEAQGHGSFQAILLLLLLLRGCGAGGLCYVVPAVCCWWWWVVQGPGAV